MYKAAYITPLLEKPGLYATDVRSYQPISNLSVVSKLLERLVAQQLTDYLKTKDLLPLYQSACQPFQSTETAVLHVLSEILTAVDREDVSTLILLNLSAAFDTVDHDILLRRLQYSYGVTGSAVRCSHVSAVGLHAFAWVRTNHPLSTLFAAFR
jgi:Reverse transcriptase (RNA-dependent DNA polymerase)